jgi:hypothetical protein
MTEQRVDLSEFMPEGWEGKLPPCMIQVDVEGRLLHNGVPLIHPGILEMIYDSVCLEDGVYLLRMDGRTCELEVADTFYVVRGVDPAEGALRLEFNDGSSENLDPTSLWVGPGDVLYCRIKGGEHRARFLRPAYYQIAKFIEEQGDGFALVLGGESFPLRSGE